MLLAGSVLLAAAAGRRAGETGRSGEAVPTAQGPESRASAKAGRGPGDGEAVSGWYVRRSAETSGLAAPKTLC